MTPGDIRAPRERKAASRAVFARFLNVATGLVGPLLRGERHPQGSLLKCLLLAVRYGVGRLRSALCGMSGYCRCVLKICMMMSFATGFGEAKNR